MAEIRTLTRLTDAMINFSPFSHYGVQFVRTILFWTISGPPRGHDGLDTDVDDHLAASEYKYKLTVSILYDGERLLLFALVRDTLFCTGEDSWMLLDERLPVGPPDYG